ncbi:hypothetical protein PIIN_09337 [Serendipita indica DSM 11827]|uniref:Uncharacterized protein n=1 Tax=Serendipita indica (strain DSM 11827) TaxID=1109443 RepID=G4TVL0_SERID|nr:hypothetical protein PIIN_09337 [Serendipita indica DSM 11827]
MICLYLFIFATWTANPVCRFALGVSLFASSPASSKPVLLLAGDSPIDMEEAEEDALPLPVMSPDLYSWIVAADCCIDPPFPLPFPPRLPLLLVPPSEIFDGDGKPVKDLPWSYRAQCLELGQRVRCCRCAAVGDWATRECVVEVVYREILEEPIPGGEPSIAELDVSTFNRHIRLHKPSTWSTVLALPGSNVGMSMWGPRLKYFELAFVQTRKGPWTTDQGSLWLRDFLPTDLSNARVLTYGYDADARSHECVSTQTMRRHADGFAKALSRKRKVTPRRPIIFVAHDLGGIILKWVRSIGYTSSQLLNTRDKALVICHNQSLESKCDLRDILISTHAILFFGTPHSGTDTTLVEAVNRLASVYMETTDIILKDLRSNSSELENVQSLYVEASANINSIFFTGGYTTKGLNVPYHSAVIAGDRNATTIVLPADHRNLVRFAAKDKNNYQTVLHYLRDYVDNAPVEVKKKWVKEEKYRSAANEEPASDETVLPKSRPPVSRNYIERNHVQILVTQKLLPDGPVKHQPRCILHGIGGAGKTQLATNWIQENEARYIIWVLNRADLTFN